MITGIELLDAQKRPYNPASFSHVYELTTKKEENDKGKWHGLEIEVAEQVTDANLYAKAKEFSKLANAGEVKTTEPVAETKEGC